MPNYRRWFVPGGTYFFTAVTFGRRQFLHEDAVRPLLRKPSRKLASAGRLRSWPGCCYRITCTPCGPCPEATPTTRCVGQRSKRASPASTWRGGPGGRAQSLATPASRAGDLAATLLGTHGRGRRGSGRLCRLCALESHQARLGASSPRLALVDLPPLRGRWLLRTRLGPRRSLPRLRRPGVGRVGWVNRANANRRLRRHADSNPWPVTPRTREGGPPGSTFHPAGRASHRNGPGPGAWLWVNGMMRPVWDGDRNPVGLRSASGSFGLQGTGSPLPAEHFSSVVRCGPPYTDCRDVPGGSLGLLRRYL